jgi:predicted DNA-binding transcriptional regulator AlpA
MEKDQLKGIEKILTEKELLELLGIKRSALDDLRHKKQLPFCKISNTNRIYLVKDVIEFIESRRMVLNRNT